METLKFEFDDEKYCYDGRVLWIRCSCGEWCNAELASIGGIPCTECDEDVVISGVEYANT